MLSISPCSRAGFCTFPCNLLRRLLPIRLNVEHIALAYARAFALCRSRRHLLRVLIPVELNVECIALADARAFASWVSRATYSGAGSLYCYSIYLL